ncbi:MAG: hypothetical protein O3C11_08210 [Proteobacteria bacterium]|nr:hypothetical protein [Pseudomonadota bacterium]
MPIKQNDLTPIRNLPTEIRLELATLVVDRSGASNEAFMRTECLLGHVNPNTIYRVGMDGMTSDPGAALTEMPTGIAPDFAVMDGSWESNIDYENGDANILGGNGRYVLPSCQQALEIPEVEPCPSHLAFYGCRLVKVGDTLSFDANAPLPVTVTTVGKTYVADYLFRKEHGGGEFLEIHDRPHFHMPLDKEATGHMLIGKTRSDGIRVVSAFRIPYGYGILTAPWAVHADSHLVGRYMVVYSVAKHFSTVIIRSSNGELARIEIV